MLVVGDDSGTPTATPSRPACRDAVVVASIDTHTRVTTLFPAASRRQGSRSRRGFHRYELAANGVYDGVSGNNGEYFLERDVRRHSCLGGKMRSARM